jgi:hypothetical protein
MTSVERDDSWPNVAVATTPLRAVDMPATEDYNDVNQWFFTDQVMHQFLCDRRVYANKDGTIRNSKDRIVGIWYFAEFSAKYPDNSKSTWGHALDMEVLADKCDASMDDDDGHNMDNGPSSVARRGVSLSEPQ